LDWGTTVFPEHRELADDGLPRWHHLQMRFSAEVNRLLAGGDDAHALVDVGQSGGIEDR
jgi:hypothetical protein